MPSKTPSNRSISRRSLLVAAGAFGLAGVGTVSGYRLASGERDDVETTRTLTVEDEFDLDDASLDPAGEDGSGGGEVSQRCDPDPDRIVSRSHVANLTMVDAWNEDYRIWGDEAEGTGVAVQNSIAVEKAPERVDGQFLYGVRLYSLCHVERDRFSRLRLRRMANELAVDPAIEVGALLPTEPVRPDHGTCTLTLMRELPSGWAAGYERTTWVNEGAIDTERDDDGAAVFFEGDVAASVAMEGLLELRSDRPLAEIEDAFSWTVRGEATRQGWST